MPRRSTRRQLRTARTLRVLATAACAAGAAAGPIADAASATSPVPATSTPAPAPASASASGRTFDFGPSGGVVAGATVRVRERPDLGTTTADDGTWHLDGLEVGATATFVLEAPGRPPVQTAALEVPPDGLVDVAFQSPSAAVVAAMGSYLGSPPDPARCQIATTVTRRGHTLGDDLGPHGEPGATVSIEPTVPADLGPIYFELARVDVIWPDRSRVDTSADGGVLFTNVPPGTYVLRGHKAGATIRPVTVECRAGTIANAAPPHGLQVTAGGLDPGDPVPTTTAPSPTSTPGPATTAPTGTPLPQGAAPDAGGAAPVAARPSYAG